ncbi:DUF262 domain-containing HNH endonuclease family protein, partial [Patescibacteria group bacterium]|nr:DUF262 domain-containing HNH endonuclease family protein [Patescibacteria group bacterium]
QIYIVDGQQRITTIVIFMRVILMVLAGKDKSKDYSRENRRYLKDKDIYKLEIMHIDNEFFKTYIIDNKSVDEKSIKTPSQKRLYRAKEYFYQEIRDMDFSVLKGLMAKVEKSKILTYSVNDTAEATLIFETTNDRGKTLTNLEKTKSFLMHKIYLTKEKPDELINSVQDRFSEIYRILEEIENRLEGDEDSILQYHFIGHFDWKYTRKTKDYQMYVQKMKEIIVQMMKSDKIKEVPDFIDNYTRELKETFNVVRTITYDSNLNMRDLFILERTSLFFPLIIKCYKLDKNNSKNDYYDVVRLLEIFSFRVYGIGGKSSYVGRDWFYTLARDFSGDFNKLKFEIKKGILEYVNDKFFEEKISLPYLYEEIYPLNLRYLFWKYENYLRANDQPKASPMDEEAFLTKDPMFKLTIEHIASQNPRVTTSNIILPKVNEEFQENYLHRLGNLTFDPNSANASRGNNDIEVKNSMYFRKAPFKTQNELESFIIKNKWSIESIMNREKKIKKFMLEYWNPELIHTETPLEAPTGTDIPEEKSAHRDIIKKVVIKLNEKFNKWLIPPQRKRINEFKLYQKKDGLLTAFYTKWLYDDAEFLLEGGFWKDENEPFKSYVQIWVRNNSEKLVFKLNNQEVLEFLEKEGYEDQSSREDRPDFIKLMDLQSANDSSLIDAFTTEVGKIKPIVEKILR